MLKITNTLSSKKELLNPLVDKKIKLYVCGITPYDYAHVGHARVYITFDLLYRLLLFLGYEVTYVRNFTDIDDKLLDRARKEFGDEHRFKEVAQRYIQAYHEDLKALNCLSPNHEPYVTDHIPEIITFIEQLIKKGKAYQVNGDVYYSITQFPEYGTLSKQRLDDLRVGARVEVNERKKDPLDFALWKSEQTGTFWKSPWGYGRPGWHIECSALAKHYLGEQIDIHGGGMDLIFPHHENEIAQSQGLTGKQFSRYWMHNAFVQINKEKMSKSLGNFFTIKDLLKQFDPMVLRYFILSHYYRSPIDFSLTDIESAQKSYKKLCGIFSSYHCTKSYDQKALMENKVIKGMLEFLCDDLNTPGALGVLFEQLSSVKDNTEIMCQIKQFMHDIWGLSLVPLPEKTVEITPEIQKLLDEREKARAARDWQKADMLRKQLEDLGVLMQDKKVKD